MSSFMGSDATEELTWSQDKQQQQQQRTHRYYSGVQPAGKPRKIRPDELFEEFPQHDVLLSSPHRHYLTKANHAYNALEPMRSRNLNVQTEVKGPLHRLLMSLFSEEVPEPTFWIGADKVLSLEENWKVIPDTKRTFALGKNHDRCYTVYQASDSCILDENYRNGRRSRKRECLPDHGSVSKSTSPSREHSTPPMAQHQHQHLRSFSVTKDSINSLDPQEKEAVVSAAISILSMTACSNVPPTTVHSHVRDTNIGTRSGTEAEQSGPQNIFGSISTEMLPSLRRSVTGHMSTASDKP